MKKFKYPSKLFAVLLFAIAACTQAPAPETFFDNQEKIVQTPSDSSQVATEEFKRLASTEGFVWIKPSAQAASKQQREAKFKADQAQITQLATQFPQLERVLKPDPNLKILPDGNYVVTIQDKNGQPFEVITQGQQATYRSLLAARANGQSTSNQLKIYSLGYRALPVAQQSGLQTPSSLQSATLEQLLAARAELSKRLEENPDLLEDAKPVLASGAITVQSEVNPNAKPSGFPANADAEEGRGAGIDRGGLDCEPTSFDQNGLYQNFWWKQKYYHTKVKSQGQRGTCVGFAVTAALEGRIAIEKSRWVNLSEQFLWSKIAGEWDAREFGDGASNTDTAEEFYDSQYGLPLEQVWNYNKSSNRLPKDDDDPQDYYTKSCENYSEFCSNTSHQREVVCTSFQGSSYCGYSRPAATGERFKQSESENIYDWSSFSLPVTEIRTLLRQGHTMIVGLDVNVGFDNPSSGYIATTLDSQYRGGHAVQIVGFISSSRIANHPDIDQTIKDRAQMSGGGYFIIKNSWGYCYGDAGYVYIPISWAEEYFHGIEVFETNPSAAFKTVPNVPPSIEITAPNSSTFNQEFNSITFNANATDPDGSIANIKWNSSLEGNLGTGTSITVSLATLGDHTIIATATDDKGATDTAQRVIKIVSQNPVVSISSPSNNQTIFKNQAFAFEGFAEDGILDVPCNKLEWTSSKAGEGPWAGCTPIVTFSSNGSRNITLTATDDNNQKGSKVVTVNVTDPPVSGPPIVQIVFPKPEALKSYFPTDNVRLSYTLTDPGATNGSQYTVVWKAFKGRTVKTIVPKNFSANNILLYKYFVPNEIFPGGACGQLYNLTVEVSITDPEGLTGKDSVIILVVGPPC